MSDFNIKKALQNESPKPDPRAKERILSVALNEFRAAHPPVHEEQSNKNPGFFQGLIKLLRPAPNNINDRGTFTAFQRPKIWIGGTITFGVALIGILWFRQLFPLIEPDHITQADNQTIELNSFLNRAKIETQLSSAQPGATRQFLYANQAHDPDIASQITMLRDNQSSSPAPAYRDRFESREENRVFQFSDSAVSTFSIDVDTASYSYVRRALNNGVLPQKAAVRIEELINYFDYNYPSPDSSEQAFKPSISVIDSPWTAGNQLIHIGIQGYDIPKDKQPNSNLVFLLDVSRSMSSRDKLPLVKQSIGLLLDTLKPTDTVAIAVYAGAAGTVLEPTPAKDKQKILSALNSLNAHGSTAGAEGIALAYQLAELNYDSKAVNRIILATDGDFNVGATEDADLSTFVERKRDKGIYLSVLGFGRGNYQDALMQKLAQNGNGVAAYIDTLGEAQKVLVNEAFSALFPIATDVKIQVEFNPSVVKEYRLIGYETRSLNKEDFNNDKVDAGDIGAGHSVTAIYEITPTNGGKPLIDESRYQENLTPENNLQSEYGFLKIRYKLPGEQTSKLISQAISKDDLQQVPWASEAHFATAVAAFGQLLKGSAYSGSFTWDDIINLAQAHKGPDEYGYRTEFIQLVRKAKISKTIR